MSYFTKSDVRKPLVYIHIPKTAGKSILWWLKQVYCADKILKNEHALFKQVEHLNYPSFTIVRNPYDRTVSLYKEYHRLVSTPSKEAQKKFYNLNIKDWNKGFEHFVINKVPEAVSKDLILPQIDYVVGHNSNYVDNIMQLEKNIDRLQDYCDSNLRLPHIGQGINLDVYWTRNMLDVVNSYFKRDFDLNYEMA